VGTQNARRTATQPFTCCTEINPIQSRKRSDEKRQVMLKYLMDENVNPVYINQLRRRKPDLIIRAIGEPDTPLKGTLDPEILIWCEAHNFVLITNNRTSMPVHLVDHINTGHHVPGIFILKE
jgi:Domain of unknown function (DUF5615)